MNIKITQEAYQNVIMHILQYGNKELKVSQEAFGLIYGIRAGDTIEIKKAIPTSHGKNCTNVFTETDKVNFSEIDGKITEEGLESFGYYISHPNMGYYLSQNEIKNLIYFHNEKKKDFAFALIGDHSQMEKEGDYGIKAMRLKNPEKGTSSDFEKIDVEVQEPHDMSLFRISKYLIEQGQKHQPYVEETTISLDADESIWDAFGGGDEDKAKEAIAPIVNELKKDIENVESSFINSILKEMYELTTNVSDMAKKSYEVPITDMLLLRESLEKGLENVKDWFDDQFIDHKVKIMREYQRGAEMVKKAHVQNLIAISKLLDLIN